MWLEGHINGARNKILHFCNDISLYNCQSLVPIWAWLLVRDKVANRAQAARGVQDGFRRDEEGNRVDAMVLVRLPDEQQPDK